MITHTFDPAAPFLANLCDLCDVEADRVLRRIRDSGRPTVEADYLGRRRETENWLIAERLRLLGETPRARPVDGFLGDLADGLDAARPRSLVMPLDALCQTL